MAASIIASVITGGANSHQTVAEELNAYATDFVAQGVVGTITSGSPSTGSFAVTQDASPDMGVTILLGQAYVSGTPSGQDAQVIRARMTSNYTAYTISANASGSTKFDWIYLQLSAANANVPSAAADNVITLVTSRSTSNASDNGSPPTYGIPLAIVTVANGASSITNGNITDKRTQASLSVQSAATTGWQTLSFPLTYGANNGSKEFTVTTPNDLTGTLSAGQKLKVTRSVTPPTQCMSFTAASSQYATKASPSGITFTGAFTCEAWIYLNSYTGLNNFIINRSDASATAGGWWFTINSNGQVRIVYGTGANFTDFLSYQSIPLKQWVHVVGVVTSVGSKTGVIYINGSSVANTSSATAATTLTQASVDLRVGAASATPASTYFDGYMSEVRVWSTNLTAQQIQDNMATNLVGNETNLVALYQGSGNFNDSTSNANNLTQSGGAIATQAANPYNATEYAIITKASYVNPNTTLTLFTGSNGSIPNKTLNSPNYSTTSSPFGFPRDKGSWRVPMIYGFDPANITSNSLGQFTGGQISVPTGAWHLILQFAYQHTAQDARVALSTSTSALAGTTMAARLFTASSGTHLGTETLDDDVIVTTQTLYYILGAAASGTFSMRGIGSDFGGAYTVVYAETNYL